MTTTNNAPATLDAITAILAAPNETLAALDTGAGKLLAKNGELRLAVRFLAYKGKTEASRAKALRDAFGAEYDKARVAKVAKALAGVLETAWDMGLESKPKVATAASLASTISNNVNGAIGYLSLLHAADADAAAWAAAIDATPNKAARALGSFVRNGDKSGVTLDSWAALSGKLDAIRAAIAEKAEQAKTGKAAKPRAGSGAGDAPAALAYTIAQQAARDKALDAALNAADVLDMKLAAFREKLGKAKLPAALLGELMAGLDTMGAEVKTMRDAIDAIPE